MLAQERSLLSSFTNDTSNDATPTDSTKLFPRSIVQEEKRVFAALKKGCDTIESVLHGFDRVRCVVRPRVPPQPFGR